MSVKDAVASRFSELCKKQGIKADELANLSGVTPSTVYSMLDSRRRDVSIVTLKKLCDGLGDNVGRIFRRTELR